MWLHTEGGARKAGDWKLQGENADVAARGRPHALVYVKGCSDGGDEGKHLFSISTE